MLNQITNLVKQFGQEIVVQNDAVPNEHNEAVINETSGSLIEGLKGLVNGGNVRQFAGLFEGNEAGNSSNPVVQQLIEQVSGNLEQKFGLSSDTSTSVASGMIPKVLEGMIQKAKNPDDTSFSFSDIVSSLTGGQDNFGLGDALSKYGSQFGLDQDGDGKVGLSDVTAVVSKKGGLGGFLGKLFGR